MDFLQICLESLCALVFDSFTFQHKWAYANTRLCSLLKIVKPVCDLGLN